MLCSRATYDCRSLGCATTTTISKFAGYCGARNVAALGTNTLKILKEIMAFNNYPSTSQLRRYARQVGAHIEFCEQDDFLLRGGGRKRGAKPRLCAGVFRGSFVGVRTSGEADRGASGSRIAGRRRAGRDFAQAIGPRGRLNCRRFLIASWFSACLGCKMLPPEHVASGAEVDTRRLSGSPSAGTTAAKYTNPMQRDSSRPTPRRRAQAGRKA